MKLAQFAAALGQRAFVGKVNMNIPRNDGYYESTEEAIQNIVSFIAAVEQIGVNLNFFLHYLYMSAIK